MNCMNCGKPLPDKKVKKLVQLTCNDKCEEELRKKIKSKIDEKEVNENGE